MNTDELRTLQKTIQKSLADFESNLFNIARRL